MLLEEKFLLKNMRLKYDKVLYRHKLLKREMRVDTLPTKLFLKLKSTQWSEKHHPQQEKWRQLQDLLAIKAFQMQETQPQQAL